MSFSRTSLPRPRLWCTMLANSGFQYDLRRGKRPGAAARSISHRVKDEVEQATGLKVARVVVSVDDVVA